MKAVFVLLVLVGFYLFYPKYDLLVWPDPFSDQFVVKGEGFYTAGNCHQQAETAGYEIYRCVGKTLWNEMLSTSAGYHTERHFSD